MAVSDRSYRHSRLICRFCGERGLSTLSWTAAVWEQNLVQCTETVCLSSLIYPSRDGKWGAKALWLSTNTNGDGRMSSSLQADSKVKFAEWPTSWRPPGTGRLPLRWSKVTSRIWLSLYMIARSSWVLSLLFLAVRESSSCYIVQIFKTYEKNSKLTLYMSVLWQSFIVLTLLMCLLLFVNEWTFFLSRLFIMPIANVLIVRAI